MLAQAGIFGRCCHGRTIRWCFLGNCDTLAFVDVNADAHVWVLKLDGTVSTSDFTQAIDFKLFPNQLSKTSRSKFCSKTIFSGR